MFRRKMAKTRSKRSFRKSVNQSHGKNFMAPIMRGGYRL